MQIGSWISSAERRCLGMTRMKPNPRPLFSSGPPQCQQEVPLPMETDGLTLLVVNSHWKSNLIVAEGGDCKGPYVTLDLGTFSHTQWRETTQSAILLLTREGSGGEREAPALSKVPRWRARPPRATWGWVVPKDMNNIEAYINLFDKVLWNANDTFSLFQFSFSVFTE